MKITSTLNLLFALGLAATARAAAPTNNPPDEILARVNGTAIHRREVDTGVRGVRMNLARQGRQLSDTDARRLERDVLDELVGRELVLQAASTTLPADLDARVSNQVTQLEARLGGAEGLTRALQEAGITPADYRRRTRENLIVEDAVRHLTAKEIQITPDEVRAFYDANRAQFRQPEMVRASHILIGVSADADADTKKAKRAQIDAARALVQGGEPFAAVAEKFSECPSKAQGGDLGMFRRGQMVPEFEQAAFSLATNQLSEVVTTQFGYHVLLVKEHQDPREVGFDEAKADIGQFLTQQKQPQIVRAYVEQLRAKAKVEILLPEPPPATVVETPPVAAPTK